MKMYVAVCRSMYVEVYQGMYVGVCRGTMYVHRYLLSQVEVSAISRYELCRGNGMQRYSEVIQSYVKI